jgi:hypothetical protein
MFENLSLMKSIAFQKLDRLGLVSSSLCAIHCAITPIVFSLMLTMGAHKAFFAGWQHLDLICLLLAPCLASLTLKEGYCKHQSKLPALIFAMGFLLLLLGYYLVNHSWHPLFMAIGGLSVASAHFLNIKLIPAHSSSTCSSTCTKHH